MHEVKDTARIQHMDVLAGDDALRKAIETLPTEAAPEGVPREHAPGPRERSIDTPQLMRMAPFVGNHAIARWLARDTAVKAPPAAAETVAMTVRWDGTEPPQRVSARTRSTTTPSTGRPTSTSTARRSDSGDGSLEVKLVKGSKHKVRVVPTPAGSDNDFYLPSVAKDFTVSEAGTVDVKLQYNRSNRWFTDESWEKVGHRPGQGRRHDLGDDARPVDPGQQEGPADGQEDQRLLRLEQAHATRSGPR